MSCIFNGIQKSHYEIYKNLTYSFILKFYVPYFAEYTRVPEERKNQKRRLYSSKKSFGSGLYSSIFLQIRSNYRLYSEASGIFYMGKKIVGKYTVGKNECLISITSNNKNNISKLPEGIDILSISTKSIDILSISTKSIDILSISTKGIDILSISTKGIDILSISTKGIDILSISTKDSSLRNLYS
ncbi:hypothetical protein BpHYR1_047904, partial [Brachionus plicatilis]